jgi:predicted Zn-dependent protease
VQLRGAGSRFGLSQFWFPLAQHILTFVLALVCCLTVSEAVAADTFASLAARAETARDANRLDEAGSLYRRALALRPSWKDGWWSLGTIYYDRDEYGEAAPAFRHLLALDGKNGTAYAMLGLCEFELGHDATALRAIQTGLSFGLLTDEPLRKVVLYHEGILLLRQRRFGSAQDALSLLASYGVREDQLATALGMAVLSITPGEQDLPPEPIQRDVVLWAGRAEMLGAQKNLDQGEKIYADLVNRAPAFANLHYAYGRYLLLAHQPDQAAAEFQQEISNNPRHTPSYLYIAAIHYRLDSAAGVKYAEDAVRLNPALPFGHYMLGLLYADTHEYAKAVPELELAAKTMNQRPDIYYALGNAYARLGRPQDAAQARELFRRMSAEAGNKDAPNIYGDNPPIQVDAAGVQGEQRAAGGEEGNQRP